MLRRVLHGRSSRGAEHAGGLRSSAVTPRLPSSRSRCSPRWRRSLNASASSATASTTFDEPYHIARRFASLDHLSEGRAGWNLVTTSNPDAARNFGREEHMEHDERYRRAREFYDVVTGLWDSWADDAFVRDSGSGLFFDPSKVHVLDHKGKYLSGARAAEHRAARAGLARGGAGWIVRSGQAARRRNRRCGLHCAAEPRRRASAFMPT